VLRQLAKTTPAKLMESEGELGERRCQSWPGTVNLSFALYSKLTEIH